MPPVEERKVIPIAARERGPGPACYALPSTFADMSRHHSPRYSFGTKRQSLDSKDSPGPVYHVDGHQTNRGWKGMPLVTMKGRHKAPTLIDVKPGPGTYNVDKGLETTPAFTIGARTRYRSLDRVPAPNSYHIPAAIGDNVPTMSNSMAPALKPRPSQYSYYYNPSNPGPASYAAPENSRTLRKSPEYTMKGRHQYPRLIKVTPGPGAYEANSSFPNKPKQPTYSLGVRHSEFLMPLFTDVTD